jgi:hypothetical protein
MYHTIAFMILFQSPRFIPHSFGPVLEGYVFANIVFFSILLVFANVFFSSDSFKVTPEIVWGALHGIMSLAMMVWWQGTLGYAALARKMQ